MSSHQKINSGAVPTSSGHNRFANKRMFIVAGAVVALVLLAIVYGVSLGVTA